MNHYLSEQLNKEKNLYILNSSKWLLNCGASSAYSSKLWYLTKTPFSNNFFKQVISDLSNLYESIKGLSKKLLILDLDDTLWGGIVGEVGWKNLRIGGHDHLGEAFRDFQIQIKSLKNQGIILALASKNDEITARSEEHTSELQSRRNLVCRLLLEKKKQTQTQTSNYYPRNTH